MDSVAQILWIPDWLSALPIHDVIVPMVTDQNVCLLVGSESKLNKHIISWLYMYGKNEL